MKPEFTALQREQLDDQLRPLRRARLSAPRAGWVRAIRDALGMNGRQFSDRMRISRTNLGKLEDSEVRGVVSMETLRRAAEALGCDLIYALVPRDGKTLDMLVQERALEVAKAQVDRVASTMELEDQAVSREFRKRETDRVAVELVRTMSRDLWNE